MKYHLGRFSLLAAFVYVVVKSCYGFQKIAWGTGVWWGEYSLKWGVAFIAYIVVCIFAVILVGFLLWRREKFQPIFERLILFRERIGNARWFLALLIFIAPLWFFQYTPWGLVFSDIYIRVLIWSLVVAGLAFFIKKGNALFGWIEFLVSILLTSSEFVIAVPFMGVTDYPFSLGWSEGNRMWDYSILFGRHIYDYPADEPIHVLLDTGRQLVGGLPFLIPGLTIEAERFWLALTVIIPYLMLGFAIFRFNRKEPKIWLLGALWVLIFLKQGPIHPPLVLCAVAVALLWRSPLWLALPLIAVTSYLAEESRFTWLFAPAMWIGMLEFAGTTLENRKLNLSSWVRAGSLGIVGAIGGYYGPKLEGLTAGNLSVSTVSAVTTASPAVTTAAVTDSVTSQPLLWYRLLPNATYGNGILVALLIAILPLIIVLFYLAATKKWQMNIWQALALIAPLVAFLGVGLVVSTKIGGGGDLHNMDMFLIGLMFASALAWHRGGKEWLAGIDLSPGWIKIVLILLLALPGLQSLGEMRSFSFADDASWLATLTDASTVKGLDMYPSKEVVDQALNAIRAEVASAQLQEGEVLFLDQRQLLTFGYVTDIPLVPEYEKKILMNQALYGDANYFQGFYDDLAEHRFSLIVSEPLRTPIKDSSYQFGEENNAWVKWVSNPVLCYYEPKIILQEVFVQLLVPKTEPVDCSAQLP